MKITVKGKEYELDDLVIKGTSLEEQELVVTAMRSEDFFEAYTSDNTYLTKLKKMVAANPKDWEIKDIYESYGEITGVRFKAPKNLLSFRVSSKANTLSEEQKAANAERLKAARLAKQNID